jgi:hypothetical protein
VRRKSKLLSSIAMRPQVKRKDVQKGDTNDTFSIRRTRQIPHFPHKPNKKVLFGKEPERREEGKPRPLDWWKSEPIA